MFVRLRLRSCSFHVFLSSNHRLHLIHSGVCCTLFPVKYMNAEAAIAAAAAATANIESVRFEQIDSLLCESISLYFFFISCVRFCVRSIHVQLAVDADWCCWNAFIAFFMNVQFALFVQKLRLPQSD